MEQRGNVQIETNAKVAAIRQDLNAFLNRCISITDVAVKEARSAIRQMECEHLKALGKAKRQRILPNLFAYAAYLLTGLLGISYMGIEPAFVSFKAFSQFCDRVDNQDQTVMTIKEVYRVYSQSSQTCLKTLQSYLSALYDLRIMVNLSPEGTIRCYQHFTGRFRPPKEKRFEDFTMLLDVINRCGISIDITEKMLYDEDLFTERFKVFDFVCELKSRYRNDAEVINLLEMTNSQIS